MSTRVCVLANWEVDDFIKSRRLPDCQHHHHIKIDDARRMVYGAGIYAQHRPSLTPGGHPWCEFQPVAEWVGPNERRIVMFTDFDYKPKQTLSGHVLFNRVER